MKISVIIACKNERDSIENTLQSVFSQTHKDFEIIVVDGNSTDGTLDVLKKYEERITLICGIKGIYQAMNKGIEVSTGDILYFLNANDSIYSNDIFEKIIKEFESKKFDIIYGDTNFQRKETKEGEEETLVNTYVSHKDFYSRFVWAYRNINHQSTFYKKELFEKYGKYDEDYKILADVEFTTRVITKKEVKHLYLPILIANYNSEGLSSYTNPESIKIIREEKAEIAKKYLYFEYVLFKIYNFIFMPPYALKIQDKIKEKFGLEAVFKIRDFKRQLGRIFVWWTSKI